MQVLITLAEYLKTIPPELATFLLAMLPVGELRGALPIALTVYKLPLWQAVFWSVLGNLLPVYFLLIFFERGSAWAAARSEFAREFLDKLYARTRRKLGDRVEKYGPWALILFVGIPLPVTGAWTGSLAAFVFGLDRKKAFLAITGGVILAAVIVSAVTLGATATVRVFRL